MRNKIIKIIDGFAFESMTQDEAIQTTDKILSLFLKEYEKGKPKQYAKKWTVSEEQVWYNRALKEVDEVIYKMLKTK